MPCRVMSLLILLAACQAAPPEPEFTDADRQAIASEIERLSSEMWALGEPEQFPEMLSFWANEPERFFVGDPAVFVQQMNILPDMDRLRSFGRDSWGPEPAPTSSRRPATWRSCHPRSPSGEPDALEHHGQRRETGPTYPMAATTLWVLEDGSWKVAHHNQGWTFDAVEGEGEG